MLARDIMHNDVVTVAGDTDVWGLARIFATHRVAGVPVVDRSGDLVGVVSQTDIIEHLREGICPPFGTQEFYADAEPDQRGPVHKPLTARDLMNREPIHADERSTVAELSRIMLTRRVHRIIITCGSKIRGIVTTMDLIKAL